MRKTAGHKHYVPDGIREDTTLEMQPLGDAGNGCRGDSRLRCDLGLVGVGIEEWSVEALQAGGEFPGEGFAGHQLNFVVNIVCCSMELGSRSDLSGFEGS